MFKIIQTEAIIDATVSTYLDLEKSVSILLARRFATIDEAVSHFKKINAEYMSSLAITKEGIPNDSD